MKKYIIWLIALLAMFGCASSEENIIEMEGYTVEEFDQVEQAATGPAPENISPDNYIVRFRQMNTTPSGVPAAAWLNWLSAFAAGLSAQQTPDPTPHLKGELVGGGSGDVMLYWDTSLPPAWSFPEYFAITCTHNGVALPGGYGFRRVNCIVTINKFSLQNASNAKVVSQTKLINAALCRATWFSIYGSSPSGSSHCGQSGLSNVWKYTSTVWNPSAEVTHWAQWLSTASGMRSADATFSPDPFNGQPEL